VLERRGFAVFRYLNSAPLLSGFLDPTRPPGSEEFHFVFGTPAVCARRLAEANVDGALIPSIEYARIEGLRLVPDIAISTSRQVRSVIVLARRPLVECSSIAIDASSRTSVALLRILLARRYCVSPSLEVMPPDAGRMLARHDAALLIADSALLADADGCDVHDLAADWHDMTGLPFVFAVWALREKAAAGLSARQVARFRESLHHGLERLEEIARRHGGRLGMSPEDALAYLRENIHYGFGEKERAGLELFLRLAAEEGLIPAEVPLRFTETPPPALAVGGRSTPEYGDDPSHP